jgi:hypothetical protein
MAGKPKEKKLLLYGGLAVGGVAVLYMVAHSGSGASAPGRAGRSRSFTPNQNQPAVDEAALQARSNAVTAFDNAVLGSRTLLEQQDVAYNTNAAQVRMNANTNKTQLSETQLQTAAEQAIANSEAQAQIQSQQIQANAEQQQQQSSNTGSWISSILSFIPSIFGFNQGASIVPDPNNDAVNQTPVLPPVYTPNPGNTTNIWEPPDLSYWQQEFQGIGI